MDNILLIEPNYKSLYAPFGLLKISNMHKSKGDKITFFKGKKIFDINFKKIYITTLFTYWYEETIKTILFYKKYYPKSEILIGGIFASLMQDFIKNITGIEPFTGLMPEAEKYFADNTINNSDTSICFTSRGCIRKCSFCVVPKNEGRLKYVDNWENNIDLNKSKISFWDNNFFAKDFETIKKDIEIIKDLCNKGVKEFDFNQGLDARLFNEDIAKLFYKMPLKPIRFSFDNMGEDGYIQKAIELCKKYKFIANKKWDADSNIIIYVLFNFKDSPEDFYYRIREIIKNGATAYPMCYSPHNDLKRNYVGDKWNLGLRNAVRFSLSMRGQISCSSKEQFEFIYGKNGKEFIEKMNILKTRKDSDKLTNEYKYLKIRRLKENNKLFI